MPDTPRGSAAGSQPWRDELGDVIAEFAAQHPWLWRRTRIRSWLDQQIGRWLPLLCRHRTAVRGQSTAPMHCLDCGRLTDA